MRNLIYFNFAGCGRKKTSSGGTPSKSIRSNVNVVHKISSTTEESQNDRDRVRREQNFFCEPVSSSNTPRRSNMPVFQRDLRQRGQIPLAPNPDGHPSNRLTRAPVQKWTQNADAESIGKPKYKEVSSLSPLSKIQKHIPANHHNKQAPSPQRRIQKNLLSQSRQEELLLLAELEQLDMQNPRKAGKATQSNSAAGAIGAVRSHSAINSREKTTAQVPSNLRTIDDLKAKERNVPRITAGKIARARDPEKDKEKRAFGPGLKVQEKKASLNNKGDKNDNSRDNEDAAPQSPLRRVQLKVAEAALPDTTAKHIGRSNQMSPSKQAKQSPYTDMQGQNGRHETLFRDLQDISHSHLAANMDMSDGYLQEFQRKLTKIGNRSTSQKSRALKQGQRGNYGYGSSPRQDDATEYSVQTEQPGMYSGQTKASARRNDHNMQETLSLPPLPTHKNKCAMILYSPTEGRSSVPYDRNITMSAPPRMRFPEKNDHLALPDIHQRQDVQRTGSAPDRTRKGR